MPHPAVQLVPIPALAEALGIETVGRHARCFNVAAHHKKSDVHPSLALFADSGRYRCFSCGVQGDAIDLVRAIKQCGFPEAVAWIESLTGQEVMRRQAADSGGKKYRRWPDRQAQDIYAALYESCYDIHPKMPAGRYLAKRGLDLDVVNEHHVARIDDPNLVWDRLQSDFSVESLKRAGLMSRAGHFLFTRHRLLFFYFDDGWPVYIQGRDITGESRAKELSLEGLVSPVVYNVDLIWERQDRIYLCEGCIDTLSALQMQLPAVGIPGVTGFHPDWFEHFETVKHVVLLFDNDEAGRRQAAELRMQFRKRGIKADAVYPPPGQDLNDLLVQSLERKLSV